MTITLSGLYEVSSFEFTNPPDKLVELFTIASTLGFDGVDYLATLPDMVSPSIKALALSRKYNVPILSLHAPLHLLLYTPAFLYTPLLRLFGRFPEAKIFNFHLSGFIHPYNRNGKNIENFALLAKEKGVMLSLESNPLLRGLGRYPQVTYEPYLFADYCVAHNLPITFDTSHVAHCKVDIVDFFHRYHANIKLIHLSDSIGSLQHLPLGRGNLPIKDLIQEIKKKAYTESITFEICHFPKGMKTAEKMQEIKKNYEFVKQYVR